MGAPFKTELALKPALSGVEGWGFSLGNHIDVVHSEDPHSGFP